MQTWTDVLKFIKINLGVPLNNLELSDDELVENLKDQVLPVFSQFAPRKSFKAITSSNIIYRQNQDGHPLYQYRIPKETNEYIIDVLNVYHTQNRLLMSELSSLIHSPMQAIDIVIANSYNDIIRSLQKRQTWEFIPPDVIIFDDEIQYAVMEYQTIHDDLSTIDPDKYHLIFKKLCLANVKLWVASMRSKFENLQTPFGPLNLNYEKLQQEGQQEREECMQLLNMLPPDVLVHVDF